MEWKRAEKPQDGDGDTAGGGLGETGGRTSYEVQSRDGRGSTTRSSMRFLVVAKVHTVKQGKAAVFDHRCAVKTNLDRYCSKSDQTKQIKRCTLTH